MPAYVIAEVEIHDEGAYAEYRAGVPGSLAPFGGRFVVRGGRAEALEGEAPAQRLVVIEFPDADAARAWYESDGYRPLRDLRRAASTARILLAEGV